MACKYRYFVPMGTKNLMVAYCGLKLPEIVGK